MLGAFLVGIALIAGLCSTSLAILSATRAFVGGEGLYSKGQKDAVRFLERYLAGGEDADFRAFELALAVPLGDRAARLELEKPVLDAAAVRAGFILGKNDPRDIDGMIRLYRRFRNVGFMADAISLWEQGDQDVVLLADMGVRARALVTRRPEQTPQRMALLSSIDLLNTHVNGLEQDFSGRLGDASRAVQSILQWGTLALAMLLALGGVHFWRRLTRNLAASQLAVYESNARWELAASVARIGVLDWNVRTGSCLLDDRAFELCGLPSTRSKVVAVETLLRNVVDSDRAQLMAAARGAELETGELTQRYRVLRVAGAVGHLELHGRALAAADGGNRIVGSIRDVTAEVQAEQMRLAKAAAEQANRAKDEFLSRVSHELRTPLNAILGFAELMRDDVAAGLAPVQAQRLERVARAGRHLLQLVNDLLNLGSAEFRSTPQKLEPVDADDALEAARILLEPMQAARAVIIEIAGRANPSWVMSDRRRLEQLFVNILSNAVKYNRPGGRVHVHMTVEGAQLVTCIEDEGIGMTAQQQSQLFQPFNRLGAEKLGIDGVGLGLVISRQLAAEISAELTLTSEAHRGTRVRIALPLAQDPIQRPTAVPAAVALDAIEMPEARVLYVEDDPVNAMLVEHFVVRWPHLRLVVAPDGETGLRDAAILQPDLILLDMQLPDMNGIAFLGRLRADPASSRLRVIALSADALPGQIAASLAAGAEAYWTKPLDHRQFCRNLAQSLRSGPGRPRESSKEFADANMKY